MQRESRSTDVPAPRNVTAPRQSWVPPAPGYVPNRTNPGQSVQRLKETNIADKVRAEIADKVAVAVAEHKRKQTQLVHTVKAEIADKVSAKKEAQGEVTMMEKEKNEAVMTAAAQKQAEAVAAREKEEAAAAIRRPDEGDAEAKGKSAQSIKTESSPTSDYCPTTRHMQGMEEVRLDPLSAWQAREERAMSVFSEASKSNSYTPSLSPTTTHTPSACKQIKPKVQSQEESQSPDTNALPVSRKWMPPVGYAPSASRPAQPTQEIERPVQRYVGKGSSSAGGVQLKQDIDLARDDQKVPTSADQTKAQVTPLSYVPLTNASSEAQPKSWSPPSGYVPLSRRAQTQEPEVLKEESESAGSSAPQPESWSPPAGYVPAFKCVQPKEIEIAHKSEIPTSTTSHPEAWTPRSGYVPAARCMEPENVNFAASATSIEKPIQAQAELANTVHVSKEQEVLAAKTAVADAQWHSIISASAAAVHRLKETEPAAA